MTSAGRPGEVVPGILFSWAGWRDWLPLDYVVGGGGGSSSEITQPRAHPLPHPLSCSRLPLAQPVCAGNCLTGTCVDFVAWNLVTCVFVYLLLFLIDTDLSWQIQPKSLSAMPFSNNLSKKKERFCNCKNGSCVSRCCMLSRAVWTTSQPLS